MTTNPFKKWLSWINHQKLAYWIVLKPKLAISHEVPREYFIGIFCLSVYLRFSVQMNILKICFRIIPFLCWNCDYDMKLSIPVFLLISWSDPIYSSSILITYAVKWIQSTFNIHLHTTVNNVFTLSSVLNRKCIIALHIGHVLVAYSSF